MFGLFALDSTPAHAQSVRLLQVGDALKFQGAECGQIGDSWVPGSILKNGKFSPLSSQISKLSAQIKRASSLRSRKALTKLRSSLARQLTTQIPICKVFEPGVTRPAAGSFAQPGATTVAWGANVVGTEFVIGSSYVFFCPANGAVTSLWGTDVYTADSGVCGAAVHAGMISIANGGNVIVRILASQTGFNGSLRNGVSTNFFGIFSKSFAFLNPSTSAQVGTNAPLVAPWNFSLTRFRMLAYTPFTFLCPANGTAASVWGTSVYTDDSSLCTAGVHAGKISIRKGGVVTAVIRAGQSAYAGTRRNGIVSKTFGTWGGSYAFN